MTTVSVLPAIAKITTMLQHFNICIYCFVVYNVIIIDIKIRMSILVIMTAISVMAVMAIMVAR